MTNCFDPNLHKDFYAYFNILPFVWKNQPIGVTQNRKSSKKTRILLGNRCFLLIFDQHRISQSKSASWKKFMNFDHRATCKKLEKSYGPVLRSAKISAFPSVHFELLCAPGALPWNAQNLGRLNVGPPRVRYSLWQVLGYCGWEGREGDPHERRHNHRRADRRARPSASARLSVRRCHELHILIDFLLSAIH